MTTNTARVSLIDGLHLRAKTGSGHTVDFESHVGDDDVPSLAPSPMEMVLSSAGACMSMDAIAILRKMREDVSSYDVYIEGDRADEHPRVFSAIRMTHRVRGRGVREASVARALQLSMTRYCPVFAMVSPTVDVSVRYEITDEETGAVISGEAEREPEAAAARAR
ncbi:MAG TPA: OsmC family protein [Dehalococcoidia bacterium]|nr:OsmC family protein [Dehalococcoidia bacterium]